MHGDQVDPFSAQPIAISDLGLRHSTYERQAGKPAPVSIQVPSSFDLTRPHRTASVVEARGRLIL